MSRTNERDGPQVQRLTAMDLNVGARIRERRVTLGLSQQQLAAVVGVTYQQTHKYERGLSRISVCRLFAISQALNMKPEWFFENMFADGASEEILPQQRMHLELMRNFALIKCEKQQQAISNMARSMAGA